MEETVGHDMLRPAPGGESPDAAAMHAEQGQSDSGSAGPGRAGPGPAGPDRSALLDGPDRSVLLDRRFGYDEITDVRHEVTARLEASLLGDRLAGFVLAVNEVITNAVLHAGGHGRLMLWTTGAAVCCTVTDSGPGIPERFRRPPAAPDAFAAGGRGIWLAYQLCDEVTMSTGPIGTTIGLCLHMARQRSAI